VVRNLINGRLLFKARRKGTSDITSPMAASKKRLKRCWPITKMSAMRFWYVQSSIPFAGRKERVRKSRRYAALLYSRATQRRNYSAKQWTRILAELREASTNDLLIKEIADALARKLNPAASDDIVRKAISQYIQDSETPQETRNSFLSSLLENTKMIADLLLNKDPWRIIRPPRETEFSTTDNPLVSFVPLWQWSASSRIWFS
jgi:hypothetical protein